MNYEWPEQQPPADEKPRQNLGSALAAGAAYLATGPAIAPITGIPDKLYEEMAAKRPITAPLGTSLQDLAEFTRAEVDAIQEFAKKKGVTAPILSAGPGVGTSYVEARPLAGKIDRIALGRASVPSAMHEIGHATPILGSSKLRDASFIGRAMSAGTPGKVLRGALLANILRGKQEGDHEIIEKAYDYAPALMGATYVPMLAEEARATAHAVKGGASLGKGMATLKELAPGYGTYAAKAITPILAALIAKKVVEALRGRKEPEQEKEAAAGEVKAPGILRQSASAAWRMNPSAVKSKSTKPNTNPSARGKGTTKLKPPSNSSYYKDLIESLHNPQRGFRITKS